MNKMGVQLLLSQTLDSRRVLHPAPVTQAVMPNTSQVTIFGAVLKRGSDALAVCDAARFHADDHFLVLEVVAQAEAQCVGVLLPLQLV